jgi:hypothetical protein
MKHLRFYFAVVLIALMTSGLSAQDENKDRIGGIRAGYNAASMYMDDNEYPISEVHTGFYAGFYRDNKIIPLLHFGTGLEYVQNGVQFNADNKRTLHYLSMPIDLRVKVGPVFALGGISPSFKVAEKVIEVGTPRNPGSDDKSAIFDAPLYIGAGVKILFFTVEARYHWGLLEVYNGYYNRYFQIGAGLSF